MILLFIQAFMNCSVYIRRFFLDCFLICPTFFRKKVGKKLIAWNFATRVVHQPASRKFPRRYFKLNGGLLRTDHRPLRRMK